MSDTPPLDLRALADKYEMNQNWAAYEMLKPDVQHALALLREALGIMQELMRATPSPMGPSTQRAFTKGNALLAQATNWEAEE